jgi:lipopolysaccharide export system protein LptA
MSRHRWAYNRRLPPRTLLAGVAVIVLLSFAVSSGFTQTPATGFSGITGDNSKKPIDIESDRLEVDDKRHLAIFIGNVSATQGDYNLRSRQLEVTYENASQASSQDQAPAKGAKPAKQPAKPADPNAAADPLTSGQIKFIHATGGKVLIICKKDEQEATGDEAFYDVKGQKITMTGDEVILTQKKNIVKGKKLLIDLASGRATVDTDGRVRAVFEQQAAGKGNAADPSSPKKKDDAPKEPPKPVTPSSGWQPQIR